MAYQKKYWFEFVSLDGNENVVELWQNTATTLVAEEVTGMAEPFIVELPQITHKFQPLRGSGCEINLLSPSDRKFFDGLYHTSMKEFMVKHYINTNINWLGYLNSELVRESYSYSENYPFQITGNDGFALLDRLQFLTITGEKYTDVKSFFDCIQIAISRIELPFTNLFISLSTTFEGQSTDEDSTLLHELHIASTNFYDEDGVAMTMRKVIESLLQPLSAVMCQLNGDIYITDIHTLASTSPITFKKFTQSTGVYIEDIEVTNFIDFSAIGYMGTDNEIEMSGGKNKQVISYSPYPLKTILPEILADLSEFTGTVPETFSDRDGGAYKYKALTGLDTLDVFSPGTLEQSYRTIGTDVEPENLSDASVCLQWMGGTAATKIAEIKVNPYVVISKGKKNDEIIGTRHGLYRGIGIKISGESEFYRYWDNGDCGVIEYKIKVLCKIGSKYGKFSEGVRNVWRGYPGDSSSWFDAVTYDYIKVVNSNGSNVAGQWMPFEGKYINSEDLFGDLHFEIYSDITFTDTYRDTYTNTSDQSQQMRIRNLSITLIDNQTGKEIGNSDIEYVGYLDKTVKEEAEKIDLICGTDVTMCDRGKIMSASGGSYASIINFTRDGQTFKIEELLLNSLSSNYRRGYITLSNLKLENKFNQLNIISDSSVINDKVMLVNSMTINYRSNLVETSLTEICEDSLTIIPE